MPTISKQKYQFVNFVDNDLMLKLYLTALEVIYPALLHSSVYTWMLSSDSSLISTSSIQFLKASGSYEQSGTTIMLYLLFKFTIWRLSLSFSTMKGFESKLKLGTGLSPW